ncbi:MAG: hypothetical protein IPO95_04350 [Rhodanobacteraceae bacterium]|nr:hypothetical protein [Rhodanobacteraceae bacterium]MBL0039962.1 hypothetical protein [Xanthomonadales bacterium]
MHRIATFALSLSVAALAGCSPPAANEAAKATKSIPVKVKRSVSALPARYDTALPESSAAMKAWFKGDATPPPQAHVFDALARGDAVMFERLQAAATRVDEADASAWAQAWHQGLHYRDTTSSFCTTAQAIVDAPPSHLRMAVVGTFAEHCAQADALALIVRADTPDWAVLAWYSPWRDRALGAAMPYDTRLADVLHAAIAHNDRSMAYEAALAMAKLSDPAAMTTLRAEHATIQDAKFSTYLAQAMQSPVSTPQATTAATADARALAARLRDLGFTRVDPDHPGDATTADDLLVEAGHGYWFDVETGTFPNEHDSLLRSLADTVRPALDDVVFEEIAPDIDDEDGGYVLRAYVDGQMLETAAENLGDWYDVDAVLRLLDAALLERRSDQRFVLLETMDQTATIIGGPGDVLRAALDAGLITSGDPKAAEALGKSFEDRVKASLD